VSLKLRRDKSAKKLEMTDQEVREIRNSLKPEPRWMQTYVNRLRRAGVPLEAAMRLVNHSSELVHQIYLREKVDEKRQESRAIA
jgi:hypothetical protein